MTQVGVKITDERLEQYLDDAENTSETIREALRSQMADEQESDVDVGLTDVQRQGLDVLLAESFETDGALPGRSRKRWLNRRWPSGCRSRRNRW